MSGAVEIGHCPLCGAYIGCWADHDRDCGRYVDTSTERCFLCGYKREKHERLCLYARDKPWSDVRKLRTNAFSRSVDTDSD